VSLWEPNSTLAGASQRRVVLVYVYSYVAFVSVVFAHYADVLVEVEEPVVARLTTFSDVGPVHST
jgi:hypothetical protein